MLTSRSRDVWVGRGAAWLLLVTVGLTGDRRIKGMELRERLVSGRSGRIVLEVRGRGNAVNLDLRRNDHVRADVPVLVARGGKLESWRTHPDNDFVAYTDRKSGASVLVNEEKHMGHTSSRSYRGSFHLLGDSYVIEPRDHGRHRRSTATRRHLVLKREVRVAESLVFDERRLPGFNNQTRYIKQRIANYQAPAHHQLRYCVETLVCLDYPIYQSWLNHSQQSSPQEAHDEAIMNIKYFYSHVVNQMDMRFSNIQVPDYRIFLALKGFYIATTPQDSYWTEDAKISSSGRGFLTDSDRALDLFEIWINRPDVEKSFGSFDQATLFTGYTLTRGRRKDGSWRVIQGLAMTRGICTEHRASVIHDHGQFTSSQNAAHEMGHNLGSLHDGTPDNACSTSGQYVMASYALDLVDGNYFNPFFFSDCSITDMREFLLCLVLDDKTCLMNDLAHNTSRSTDRLLDLPGQRFTYDEQCEQMVGPGSFYCRGIANDRLMCKVLSCYDPTRNACILNEDNRAYDGTVCGDNKWCLHGYCEYDPGAQRGRDTCVSGDYTILVYCSSGTHRTCPEMGAQEPWDCYERLGEACCETCGAIYRSNISGCEYGDRGPHCKSMSLHQCYDNVTRATCCETCQPLEGAPKGCEFGNRGSHCDGITLHQCYTTPIESSCCHTCQPLEDAVGGCEYGNRHVQCESIRPRDCYTQSMRDLCCITCRPPEGAPHGCEFGDRADYCETLDLHRCYIPDIRASCCKTCRPPDGAVPGCEYGNHASYCQTVAIRECYRPRTRTVCCRTCQLQDGAPQGCAFGDQGAHCAAIVPRDCYVNSTREICCQTCHPPEGAPVGCEFGNRGTGCSQITLADCYRENKRRDCCEMCRPLLEATTGCEFGNRGNDCVTKVLSDCYENSVGNACCELCKPLEGATAGCEYGSRGRKTYCGRKTLADCYDESTRTDCCQLCLPVENATTGCEYGNRGTDCNSRSISECSERTVRGSCCELCGGLLDSGGGCAFGDQGAHCAVIVPRDCYVNSTREICCQTCHPPEGAPVGCEYGDRGATCSSLELRDCYKQTTRKSCCATCRPQEGATKGCEFGDRGKFCVSRPLSSCYTKSVRDSCCAKCRPQEGATEGCEFGDKASWCSTTPRSYCYLNYRICCQSCAEKADNSRPNCLWGDKLAWCSSIRLSECYRWDKTCCERCRKLRETEPKLARSFASLATSDCPYGDRSDYCLVSQCKNRRYWKSCCLTCRAQTQACTGGDRATWCRTASASMCYGSWHICCKTCSKRHTGNPVCPYGDRLQWCSNYISRNPTACDNNQYIGQQCCASCVKKP